jgi:hypothetical protein
MAPIDLVAVDVSAGCLYAFSAPRFNADIVEIGLIGSSDRATSRSSPLSQGKTEELRNTFDGDSAAENVEVSFPFSLRCSNFTFPAALSKFFLNSDV